eukprot:1046122-Pelagomonas_calceolata.AAC.1
MKMQGLDKISRVGGGTVAAFAIMKIRIFLTAGFWSRLLLATLQTPWASGPIALLFPALWWRRLTAPLCQCVSFS